MSGKIPSELPEALLGRRPGGHTSWGLGGPRLPVRSYGSRGGAPSPTETRAPAACLSGSLDPGRGPLSPRPRSRTGPAAARLRRGGWGRESGRAYRVIPGSPRGQVHVRPLDSPRFPRGQAERGRDRRRPWSSPSRAFGAPLSPWPCDPNFLPSRGAGSFRALRMLGSVSAADV